MKKFSIEIVSQFDKTNLVAEIWYEDNLIAEISYENEDVDIELYSANFKYNLNDFLATLENARDKLLKR